ncbi:MAG: hypothetical protein M3165_08215 [Actinomycetota bacterium]|nr:hypothetical protein [Actinomycetota bacterium]
MQTLLLTAQLSRGLLIGILLTTAMAMVLVMFAGGYWYLVKRDHQSDDLSDDYADEERGPRG